MIQRTAPALLALALLPPAAAADDNPALALQARAVLKTHCQRCHNGEGSEGGNFDVLREKSLTAAADGDKPVVVAGKPDASPLWQRAGVRKNMPPKSVKERPSDAELATLKKWIEVGAPPFPEEQPGRKFVPLVAVLTTLRDDLRSAAAEDRPYLRYFTLTHLYNNPRVPDADLAVYRAALSKALNSLSWKSRIVLPRPIDKEQTLFAVDIRDLDWDRDRLWGAIMGAYPYGLTFGNHADEAVAKLDDDIQQLTRCELPVFRADWLAAVATRPPLYHVLLKLPQHAGELERRLQVDVADNFRRDRLARAGFTKSGVSEQNRLIERHDAVHGAYWKSYDFK